MAKPFPRRGAYVVLLDDGRPGVIAQYPQTGMVRTDKPDPTEEEIAAATDAGEDPYAGLWEPASNAELAEIHTLDENTGETVDELRDVSLDAFRIATLEEIPAPRRPENEAVARALGYLDADLPRNESAPGAAVRHGAAPQGKSGRGRGRGSAEQ